MPTFKDLVDGAKNTGASSVERTLQERYIMLTASLGEVNIPIKNPNVDIKEIDRLILAIEGQITALQSTRSSTAPQESSTKENLYLLATVLLSENKPAIDEIIAGIASAACIASKEFALPFFQRSLIYGITRPGFITVNPLTTTPSGVGVMLHTKEILGTQQELEQTILETRSIMNYGNRVGIHMANLFWYMDYRAAREGVVPYKTIGYKKFSTYRSYGFTRIKGTESIRIPKDGQYEGSPETIGIIGTKVRVPDQGRYRRGIAFYRRVTDVRLGLAKGKALFWYLLENGTGTIAGRAGGRPYPEFEGTRFIGAIKTAVETFLYQRMVAQYPEIIFSERKITGADYGPELDRLLKIKQDLKLVREDYLEILKYPGGKPKDEKAYRQNFQKRVQSVVSSLDTEIESKFSTSQIRENIAKARLEKGLLRTISGEVSPNYRVYLGTMQGKIERKRLTLLARSIQATVPTGDPARLMKLMQDMKQRMIELDKVIADNIKILERIKLIKATRR